MGAMEAMRKAWTDERLDDLAARVDRGFDRVDRDLRDLHLRIDSMQRTMIQVGGALTAGVLGLMVAVLGLMATQL